MQCSEMQKNNNNHIKMEVKSQDSTYLAYSSAITCSCLKVAFEAGMLMTKGNPMG